MASRTAHALATDTIHTIELKSDIEVKEAIELKEEAEHTEEAG